MSRERAAQHLPVILTVLVALGLTIMPLPRSVEAFRPDWVALTMIFWAFSLPRSYSVGIAWLVGIVLDVAQGTLLGQHALALTVVVFLTVRFHLLMRVFPLIQLSATIFALLALYQFLLFWINGVVDVRTPAITYWGPVVTGFVIWPLLFNFLTGVRYRVQLRT
ncbi:MAG TPA: rod shape-determining protein MreD [Woeseiaceae bacterium]|nr:rod shape-determining protein MreD [Woeseiaceae bacterium]